MEPLRQTNPPPPPERTPKPRLDITHLWAERDRLPLFWFGVAVLVSLVALYDRHHLIQQFQHRERVVILDPSQTYHVSPLLPFEEATALHVQQAELATTAFLSRHPKDFDQVELLKKLFLAPALQKAEDLKAQETPEFRAKQLHQKPEIGKIDILSTRENEVLASITGQVLRTGIFEERTFAEAFPFKLTLRLIRNPNMALNHRFPTAVGDFTYERVP